MMRIIEIAAEWLFSLLGIAFLCGAVWHGLKQSDDPAKILFKFVVSVVLIISEVIFARKLLSVGAAGVFALVGSVAICGFVLSGIWITEISTILISPITSMFDGGNIPIEPKPFYSIAISKRKRNKPVEAIQLIREQLAKFPNDFEGIMMLAGIQADDMKDLPSAAVTLDRFCEWEQAPPRQVAAALTQLADWHMKYYQDTFSARVALERIAEKYPDTELALVAKQRIAHLGGTGKRLMTAHNATPVVVPEGVKNVGLLESSAHLAAPEIPPSELAAAYVKQLQEYPDDTEAREKLAVIYGTHYQRLDMATTELTQMIEEPNHPPKRVAHWLNLLADLQVKCGADYDTVRATLEKIVERFPDFAFANQARSRLAHLKLEFKGLEKTENKTLGEYEQNIGLKGKRTY